MSIFSSPHDTNKAARAKGFTQFNIQYNAGTQWNQAGAENFTPKSHGDFGSKLHSFTPDPSIRMKSEKDMLGQGFYGGSGFYESRGLEAAYHRVMLGVVADMSAKESLYRTWDSSKTSQHSEQFFLPGQWEWPEFDKWKAVFFNDDAFPYMWRKYPEICIENFESMPLIYYWKKMPAMQLKEISHLLGIELPQKIKKQELMELLKQQVTFKSLYESCPELYNELKEGFEVAENKAKCAILEHYIQTLGYHLRDFYTNPKLKLWFVGDCPVEIKYAKGRGAITEENIPPFFPGDRTGVSFIMQRQ